MDWLDIREFISDSFQYLLIFVFVLLTVIYVISFTEVIGPSMESTLKQGNITLLIKAQYKFFKVNRGDVISFKTDMSKYLIKRVIGLPGETIECKDNKIYIDGKLFVEEYLDDGTVTSDFKLGLLPYNKDDREDPYTVIPDNMYFVLGDNREDSDDSRVLGLVKKSDIIGHVVLRLFPFDQIKIVN